MKIMAAIAIVELAGLVVISIIATVRHGRLFAFTMTTEDILVISGMIVALVGAIVFLFRQLMVAKDNLLAARDKEYALLLADKDKQNKDLESAKNSMKEIASEAVRSYLETANFYRQQAGKPPIVPLVPVISESHSPPTKEQLEAAEIATMRAKMAAINLVTGIEPRKEHESVNPNARLEDVMRTTKADVMRIESAIDVVPEKVVEKLGDK